MGGGATGAHLSSGLAGVVGSSVPPPGGISGTAAQRRGFLEDMADCRGGSLGKHLTIVVERSVLYEEILSLEFEC